MKKLKKKKLEKIQEKKLEKIEKFSQKKFAKNMLAEEKPDFPFKIPSNSIKVKVSFDTLPPLPKMQIPSDFYDGRLKIHELLTKIGLDKRKEFQKNESILVFLRSSFLVNQFDTLADLAHCFGVKGGNASEVREINLKISSEVSWG